MKNHIWSVPGGGIFSRIFHCAIAPLVDVDFDNVYLKLVPFELIDDDDVIGEIAVGYVHRNINTMKLYGIQDSYDYILKYILDQQLDHTYQYQGILPVGPSYDKEYRIEDSPRLQDYRRVISKLKFRQDVIQNAEKCCATAGINQRTLGVHVRLTTMNLHTIYQQVTLDDYIQQIEKSYARGNYDKIFIASDNQESLELLSRHFGNLITSYPDFHRYSYAVLRNESDWALEADWFFHESNWHQAFYEMITLAHCGGLVCRESNLANMAVVWSRSLQQIDRVYARS